MRIKLIVLKSTHELFGGYAYAPYAWAMKVALGDGENYVANVAIRNVGAHEVAETDSADIILVIVERCPCCAGGAERTVTDLIHSDKQVVTVCPLPGVDTKGEKYDFHMREEISFYDPKYPDRQRIDLARGEAIEPEKWRGQVIEGIAKLLA